MKIRPHRGEGNYSQVFHPFRHRATMMDQIRQNLQIFQDVSILPHLPKSNRSNIRKHHGEETRFLPCPKQQIQRTCHREIDLFSFPAVLVFLYDRRRGSGGGCGGEEAADLLPLQKTQC
jgi:hypothetical protein